MPLNTAFGRRIKFSKSFQIVRVRPGEALSRRLRSCEDLAPGEPGLQANRSSEWHGRAPRDRGATRTSVIRVFQTPYQAAALSGIRPNLSLSLQRANDRQPEDLLARERCARRDRYRTTELHAGIDGLIAAIRGPLLTRSLVTGLAMAAQPREVDPKNLQALPGADPTSRPWAPLCRNGAPESDGLAGALARDAAKSRNCLA